MHFCKQSASYLPGMDLKIEKNYDENLLFLGRFKTPQYCLHGNIRSFRRPRNDPGLFQRQPDPSILDKCKVIPFQSFYQSFSPFGKFTDEPL